MTHCTPRPHINSDHISLLLSDPRYADLPPQFYCGPSS
jgi:hypothetical protein